MGKASRIKQQSAREKIAAQRAAAQRAQRRNRFLIIGGSVLAVIAIIGVLVGIKLAGGPSSGSAAATSQLHGSQLTSVMNQVTGVPPSTLAAVGRGTTFQKVLVPVTGAPPLTANGKPEMLYVGAEYCPFCATERWAMAVALSRFGTFRGVGAIHSDPNDTPPSIPTLTFYKSSYTSKYLTFTPVETQTVNRKPLQNTTPQQQALVSKYDAPPYSSTAGSIPFVSFGNKYVLSGASYSYTVLQGKTWSQIANALHNPGDPISQGVIGTANKMTAAICKMTNNQPSNVCGSPLITSLQGQL